jgi:ferrous iron transport protein B
VLASILIDGIIGGFIAIVSFLPLIMIMYFLIALLEDCGYMARAAVVLEPIMKKVGLNGKSVIPFIMGTGCAIPGVMASRTIRDERERRATAILAPFMPCGAKLPVIAMFAGSFFKGSAAVGALMYFVGIFVIIISALVINKITGNGKKSYFIIELPEYKAPDIKKALMMMLGRGWSFIVKAGTIILLCNFAVHLMQSYTPAFTVAESADESILAFVALPFAYLFAPIVGKVSWQLASASITGFIAKENVVSTLAVSFGIVDTGAGAEVAAKLGILSFSALAYLMFNLFTPPCFAAIGAMNAELKSKKWLFGAIALQLGVGYTIGFLANFFGALLTKNPLPETWMLILGFAITVTFLSTLTYLMRKNKDGGREKK